MSYFELVYAFLFLPVTVIIYNLIPKKYRHFVLLIASFIFFTMISKALVIFLVFSIVTIYFGGLGLSKLNNKQEEVLAVTEKEDKKIVKGKYKRYKKLVLLAVILLNVSFLFYFKYLKFFLVNTNLLLDLFNVDFNFKIVKHLAPIGISFYTLQALSYIIDVYLGKISAEKNFFKVALFTSFFPQIMEGPIARFADTADALMEGNKVTYHNFCFGYQRLLYGFFKKYVIADRINILVKIVFENYTSYSGVAVWAAVIGYTIMLYAEFSGTMDVVIGSGEMFGVKIPENFRQPFFAKNVAEFWTRWHITLGTWFKDYIFYPVSLSKPMKKMTTFFRKYLGNRFGALVSGSVALLCVWLLNGLWHGAGWHYIFFGLFHFTLILLGNIFEPLIIKWCEKLKINRQNIFYRVFQSVKMTFFIFIGELFFRAPDLAVGFGMLKKMFTNIHFSGTELLSLGLDIKDYFILLLAMIFIFIISILKEKGINIRESVSKKPIVMRWCLYYALILAIIVFGAYGPGYAPVDPIYADF